MNREITNLKGIWVGLSCSRDFVSVRRVTAMTTDGGLPMVIGLPRLCFMGLCLTQSEVRLLSPLHCLGAE